MINKCLSIDMGIEYPIMVLVRGQLSPDVHQSILPHSEAGGKRKGELVKKVLGRGRQAESWDQAKTKNFTPVASLA